MSDFKGFTSSESFTRVPDTLFHLLKEIGDAAELKVTLYAIWRIEHIEGNFRALCETDFEAEGLGLDSGKVRLGLEKAVKRGTLLRSRHEAEVFYFLNSPRGRLAAEAFANGNWRDSAKIMSAPPVSRPNAFSLYEQNIGPLTPLIADILKDAETIYSPEWLADAIALAAENNKRNWKYIEAILKRWKEEGRAEKQNGRDHKKDGKQSVDRKIEQLRKRAGKK
jgi:DnaD/phage-associated family protein